MSANRNTTKILGVKVTGTTGTTSTNLVYSTSPTLTTPTLGVATATSVNKLTITAPATSATLTIADGKTLTASNTLTFTGTDSSSINFGTGGTVLYSGLTSLTTLTTLGTITTGTWNGSAITSAYGGVPTGGTTGQMLVKSSGTNYDYTWGTPVSSVSGTSNRITVATGTSTPVIDISSSYVGQTSITTLGTITTGIWNGTTISTSKGGTGLTAIGSANQVLKVNSGGTALEWGNVGAGTVTSTSGTTNRITVANGTSTPVIDIAATYVGQSSITTLGTVTTGTWSATAVGATFGGTGQTSWTTGQMLYASATNTLSKLNPGTNGQVLQLVGGVPAWASVAGAGTVTSVGLSAGSTGLSVTGSPITSSGTFTLGGTLNAVNGGTGTNTYAAGDLLYASAINTLAKRTIGTAGQALVVSGGLPTWGQVSLATGVTGDLPLANLAQGSARSLLGVAGNIAADYAPIQGSANQIARIDNLGTALAFGSINLASSAAVGSSVLPTLNGGTGQSTYSPGEILVGTSGGTLAKTTITSGTGITVTNASGAITVSSSFNTGSQTLTDASTTVWNVSNGEFAIWVIGNVNRTLSITNPVVGRTYTVEIHQGTGGNKTVSTWPTGTTWVGGPPTLSAIAGQVDVVSFLYNGSGYRAVHDGPFA